MAFRGTAGNRAQLGVRVRDPPRPALGTRRPARPFRGPAGAASVHGQSTRGDPPFSSARRVPFIF